MNSENILAVNVPNMISITLMALVGFFILHVTTTYMARRNRAVESEG